MKTPIFRYLFLLLFFAITFPSRAQDFIKLEGKILAADSKTPVPIASVGIPEKGIGNISNEAGDFELKIPVSAKDAKVCITALGFKELCLPAATFKGQNHTVFLEPANLQIATVEIKALSAENLVKEAIKRIPENYSAKPVHYTFYQRQSEVTNHQPTYVIESVNEAYRNHPKKDYQLTIRKSRGMATSQKNQKEMNDTWVSVYTILAYTDLSEYRPFLHPSKHKTYSYQLEKEDLIGQDTVFVISFKPKLKKNGQEIAGSEGNLFIHHRSKAIIRIESKSNKTELFKTNNALDMKLAYKMCNCVFELTASNNVLNFKKIGKHWYLNDAYNEGFHTTTGDAYPKPEYSLGITQLVVTIIQTVNAQEIPETERVKPYRNPYSTAPKDMNEAYWQQYNVIPLPAAYQKQQMP